MKRTKTASVRFNENHIITCVYEGKKDKYGKAVWTDAEGNEYELFYEPVTKKWTFA